MVKRATAKRQTRQGKTSRQKSSLENGEVERILRAATLHLITHHGMFLVATAARQTLVRDLPVWIITVTLRFDVGQEGYIGDLLYDGEQFMFLTDQAVMDERARKIAEDPEGLRKWNEYRASTLLPRKA